MDGALKALVGVACIAVIAMSAVVVAPAVKRYSDSVDDAKWAKITEDRARCDEYAREAERREKGEIHKINESDTLFQAKWRMCRDDFPGVYSTAGF